MENIFYVAKREFKSYFLTPVGYVMLGLVGLLCGIAFVLSFLTYVDISQSPFQYGYSSVPDFEETFLSPFFVFCGILIMFLSPLITMRLFSEEYSKGTIELLFTYPIRDRDIILGKFLASLGILTLTVCVIAGNSFLLLPYTDIEPIVLIFGLFSVFLMGMAVLSIGMFVSSLISTPITAGLVSFGVYLVLFIAGNVAEKMPEKNPAPESLPQVLQKIIENMYFVVRSVMLELPLDNHAKNMALGIFEPKDIVYYLLWTVFFIFLTFRSLESRNWKG
ncbi:MAG: ABC transporter permease subunit [Candidatus Hydrogenedentes bacterium]|nr:ABC transporter permease subunit [Candidatus Hydrogenedentota bacterium]